MGCMKSKIRNEETVKDPNKFATAHLDHAMSLKNIGAALSDYVQEEFVYPAGIGGGEATIQLPLPPRGKRGAPGEGKTKRGLSLSQIFVDLNDCFLKSSESARDISRLLEETHLHHKRGHIDHSARNRSFDDGVDNFDSEKHESLAAVSNKMLMVWEKKLCDDVKYQIEEWKLSIKCARSKKEHYKRAQEFDNWWNKHKMGKTNEFMPLYEKHVKVATLKHEGNHQAHQRKCIQVKQMSLMSLKSNLPVLFKALSDFSLACSDMYSNLRCLIVGEVQLVGILEDDDPNFVKTIKSRLD